MSCFHCSVTCFNNHVSFKAEYISPLGDKLFLNLTRFSVVKTKCLHDTVNSLIMVGYLVLGCLNGINTFVSPWESNLLYVSYRSLTLGYTVFNKVFDKVSRKMQSVIEIHNSINLRLRKCLAKVCLYYKKQHRKIIVRVKFIQLFSRSSYLWRLNSMWWCFNGKIHRNNIWRYIWSSLISGSFIGESCGRNRGISSVVIKFRCSITASVRLRRRIILQIFNGNAAKLVVIVIRKADKPWLVPVS